MPSAISNARLDHVAVAVPDIETALRRWVGDLGGQALHGWDEGTFSGYQVRYSNDGKLELVTPGSTDHGQGFVTRFLQSKGAGVHHVTFKVPSLTAALGAVESHGLDPVDVNMDGDWWKEAFLRPSQVGRIVIQLAEQGHQHWELMEQPAPTGASLVGPLLGVESLGWAEGLYSGILGGTPEKDDAGRLCFRWPDSPLVITVVESAQPGPQCLLVDGWDGSLDADPALGAAVKAR